MSLPKPATAPRTPTSLLSPRRLIASAIAVLVLILAGADSPSGDPNPDRSGGSIFAFLDDSTFGTPERIAVFGSLAVSILALIYAWVLSRRVLAAEMGTNSMREIAAAVRSGSDAYLKRQFVTVGILLVILTALLAASKWPFGATDPAFASEQKFIAISRAIAFFFGAIFSGMTGFFGMRLATTGNLRVAAAARAGFPQAMKLGYMTGTVTGLLTTGLGLMGGCLMVLIIGEQAYLTLLGFAFGGSLLALFMRVGGGIYTKAADVGADLVGKVENSIPEDDPRNAATIADNVGDNVGDCAGMAADVFESYTVTMVAAMILGYAAFGPKAMLVPLLFQAAGILATLFSTSLIGKLPMKHDATGAMKAINSSFRIGAILSAIGFFVIGATYLRFDAAYVTDQAICHGLTHEPNRELTAFWAEQGFPEGETVSRHRAIWKSMPLERQTAILETSLPVSGGSSRVLDRVTRLVPLTIDGPEFRPVYACLVGIVLTLFLMKCTEYWTSTDYKPVRSIVAASKTGHATNIIQGIAVGYESAVWSTILIAIALFGGMSIYSDTGNPVCIAFGISLAGIGMLALTGDTLSMDVFGPISDNASGIGEMGYNRDEKFQPLPADHPDYMSPAKYDESRRILTDLDAVGNTTKAITKGIAIGSAVLAAVSLFASFIAVLVKGNEELISQLIPSDFEGPSRLLSVASPQVFIGMLIGGAVPFLFSSMLVRAVGRAACLIVNECRAQFRNPKIMLGTEKPNYSRVVDICTAAAQKELVGPGLLAIGTPILVGFLMGPFALGGFLAGLMVVGQLLAVFMSTAGGAWDNSKKMIEDEPKSDSSGKGSEKHRASVTGDTVGDPLKDTAGPAINPLIKVMNMVSLLILPLVLVHNVALGTGDRTTGYVAIAVSGLAIAWAWWQSSRETAMEEQI